jgi:hypothetical protein
MARSIKFKVAAGAILALAGLGLVKRLVQRRGSKERDPRDYIPKEPPPLPKRHTTVSRRTTSARTKRP